ncbi:MAG: DUF11 domain-containing protein [Thermoleophilia bacterium]
MTRRAGRAGLPLILVVVLWALAVAPASAQQPERLVTYAARSCPAYTDITANRARNDIQESLRDLGADTLYTAGEAIGPAKEQAGQPRCVPITNWRFTLGTGYQTRAVDGPWGSLSRVLNPYATSIVTRASTPLLDSQGRATGAQLPGAVTVPLTADQAKRASSSSSLWVQGGAVDDPVLDQVFPGEYGFGALRCAIDNLNGDNVEWIAYPTGASHVFCYAYYVRPPPESGTIVVRKVVDAPAGTADRAFTFEGNISYTEDHTFALVAGPGRTGSQTFYRAAGATPWNVTEQPTPGWQLSGLACASETGRSTTTTDVATGAASIRLAAADTVTCTYTNRLVPPKAGLVLSKVTLGGTGAFRFAVAGAGDTARQVIRTTEEGVPTAGPRLDLEAGDHTIAERLPAPRPDGRWVRVRAVCDGRLVPVLRPVELTLAAGKGSSCEFTNRFVPSGSLEIDKVTHGGAGTAGFLIQPVAGPARTYEQQATTTREGVVVRATGDSTDRLRLGTYEITETGPPATAGGRWTLESVVCGGVPVPAAQGRVRVTLTRAAPALTCVFANRLVLGPEPPPDPTPPAPDADSLAPADGPEADLAVTKTVAPQSTRPGRPVVYTVRVTNRGPDRATDVVGVEVGPPSMRRLVIHTTRGVCLGTRPAACRFGALDVGQTATVTVRTTARDRGRVVNRVAVLSAVHDPDLRNNRSFATLRVAAVNRPPVTG